MRRKSITEIAPISCGGPKHELPILCGYLAVAGLSPPRYSKVRLACFILALGMFDVSNLHAAAAIDLDDIKTDSGLEYSWAGAGASDSMSVTIVNHTETDWIVHIEEGLRMVPANGDAQSMMVT